MCKGICLTNHLYVALNNNVLNKTSDHHNNT